MATTTMKKIFIQDAKQISIQQPLSEQWMENPVWHHEPLVFATNPSFRDFFPPNEVRRMGNLIKRAIVTSLKVLEDTNVSHPDAIITGTSIGSLDCTERFLHSMILNQEETLSPTYFMQSTHNTVSSSLAIYTKTHSYNTTYSHGSVSFDLALLDAYIQMKLGKINNALVGGHDEMVENYFSLLQKTGYVGQEGMVPCGEVAMAAMLSVDDKSNNLCQLGGIRVLYKPSMEQFQTQLSQLLTKAHTSLEEIDGIMTGINGNPLNDACYHRIAESLFPDKPLLHYKHLFGENYTVSALALYTVAHCLKRNYFPDFLSVSHKPDCYRNILLINHNDQQEWSMILLKQA